MTALDLIIVAGEVAVRAGRAESGRARGRAALLREGFLSLIPRWAGRSDPAGRSVRAVGGCGVPPFSRLPPMPPSLVPGHPGIQAG